MIAVIHQYEQQVPVLTPHQQQDLLESQHWYDRHEAYLQRVIGMVQRIEAESGRPGGKRAPTQTRARGSVRVETDQGERFDRVSDAARQFHISAARIYQVLKDPNVVCAGRRWKYADAPRPAEWDQPRPRVGHRHRPLVTSLGEHFSSAYAAARGLGCGRNVILRALREGRRLENRQFFYADEGAIHGCAHC
jgi:hypothetical protein